MVHTETWNYADQDVALKGWLARPKDPLQTPLGAVLVEPEWWGLTDYIKSRAEQLAGLGFIALAADLYGDGRTTQDPKQAGAWMQHVRADLPAWRRRALAGFEALQTVPGADPQRLAVVGYCFGGTTALQLAWTGAPAAVVASFHGGLVVPSVAEAAQTQGKVLVCHGAADGMIAEATAEAFRKAMNEAGVDWQMIYYAGAVHGFTNPKADSLGIPGIAYHPTADRRSWNHLQLLLAETFG